MANTQLSSLTESVKNTFNKSKLSSDPTGISLVGTLADPANLLNVSNANTAMTVDSMTNISAVMVKANLALNLEPAANLFDCVMNLEDRIMAKAQEKAMELLTNNSTAKDVVSKLGQVQAYASTLQEVINVAKLIKERDLLTEIAIAKGLQGLAKVKKVQEILTKFGGAVNNITDMINNLDVLDICSAPNYTANGAILSNGISSPAIIPMASPPTHPGATVNTQVITAKNDYDGLMFEIKNYTGKDTSKTGDSSYVSMITSVNTIALAYHDKLMKSKSNADDARFASEFKTSVGIELNTHNLQWNEEIKTDYNNRCNNIGISLGRSGDIVRAYAMRNQIGPVTGSMLSTGVTVYGGPNTDYTTFLDIKPSQRPPELTAYWQSRGYKIPSGNTYTNSKGKSFRIGTLDYEDAFKGPFSDRLIDGFSCASTRVPIGSVLALKNPDGTPYNPSGKNPSGVYTVHDTGNQELTYKKVDIFALNPEPYKASNMAAVQVFLVSRGSKEAPQYKKAQARFGP
jgi:hypothetical protein